MRAPNVALNPRWFGRALRNLAAAWTALGKSAEAARAAAEELRPALVEAHKRAQKEWAIRAARRTSVQRRAILRRGKSRHMAGPRGFVVRRRKSIRRTARRARAALGMK